MLPCGAAYVMEWKWSCGGGAVQARRRQGAREASVDNEGGPEGQPTVNPSAATAGATPAEVYLQIEMFG
jgi:hypothetical protein